MIAPTHLVAAQTCYLAGCVATAHTPILSEALLACVAGILPDIDKRQSYIGRLLPFISTPVEYWFGHRTFSHSLLFQILLLLPAYLWLPHGYTLALFAGLFSHSTLDMMTESGVAWFYPSRVRCVIPGNPRYRMGVMSQGELIFLIIIATAGPVFMHLAKLEQGTAGLIQTALGRIESARQQYDAEKGSHAWLLKLEGRDNRSFADISGRYPIIGAWGESGFIVETNSGSKTVCLNQNCHWYADHAVLIKGKAETTTTTTIKTEQLTVQSLINALADYQQSGKVYILGQLQARQIVSHAPTVEASGEQVALYYATADMIRLWPKQTLRLVDITLQLRHAPDLDPPKLTLENQQQSPIPILLQRWIIPATTPN